MEFTSLRAARKAAGLTQDELAKKVGINRATLSKYESGLIAPDLNQLRAIAAALDVSLSSLVDGPIWSETTKNEKSITDRADQLSDSGDTEMASLLLEQAAEILDGDIADDLQIERRINIALAALSHEGRLLALELVEALAKCERLQ